MFHILVVDDNPNIRKLCTMYLEREGYDVLVASDGEEALVVLDQEVIDLIVLDIMMPNMNGYTLTEQLREAKYSLPILMITAKGEFEDKKKGFGIGADDYMVKPIDFDELVVRVAALLRRANIATSHQILIGEVVLDYDELTVTRKNESILLPAKEFYLLFMLLSYPKKIFTRQALMDEIWGYENETDQRTVDVHIKRLREKFEHMEEFQIETVRGLGYKAVKNI